MILKFVLIFSILMGCFGVEAQETKNPLPFDWNQGPGGTPFYYSVRDQSGQFQWDSSNWWPTLYDGQTLDELNQEWFRPGHGTVLIDTENHGNVIAICHSGTLDQQPLQCEEWRRVFEPESFWLDHMPSAEEIALQNEQRLLNMQSVLGWQVRMLQGNSPDQHFEVVDVAFIPHESVEDFRSDTKTVLDKFLDHAMNPEAWEEAVTSSDQYLILIFCGWGPYTPETQSEWGSWTRYGVLLRPIS